MNVCFLIGEFTLKTSIFIERNADKMFKLYQIPGNVALNIILNVYLIFHQVHTFTDSLRRISMKNYKKFE